MECPICGSPDYESDACYCPDCGYSLNEADYTGIEHGDRD